ncbi:MAG: DUF3306 domain-containing protein [Betaproteobacteria bacterium]|nr:DUF3306 domain-containing protein [Betaproteobacteria bacterium]
MARDDEDFLRRWSRRKLDAPAKAPAAAPAVPAEAPPLPSPESLTFESDFRAFMQSKVAEGVKRAALKKLFADPRFNVMDGLDVYIDDYSKDSPIPPEMLAQLQHSRSTLFGRKEQDKTEAPASEPQPLAQAPGAEEAGEKEEKKEDDGTAG